MIKRFKWLLVMMCLPVLANADMVELAPSQLAEVQGQLAASSEVSTDLMAFNVGKEPIVLQVPVDSADLPANVPEPSAGISIEISMALRIGQIIWTDTDGCCGH